MDKLEGVSSLKIDPLNSTLFGLLDHVLLPDDGEERFMGQ
jgi:hypothetical protein